MGKSINERVKVLRTHLSMTGEEFASLVGLTSAQLSRIENKKADPQTGTINKIIAATNVSHEWLVFGKGELKAHVVHAETQSSEGGVYRDYAIKRLEEEADTWKRKYEQVWNRLEFFLERLPLEQMMGKLDPDKETAPALRIV